MKSDWNIVYHKSVVSIDIPKLSADIKQRIKGQIEAKLLLDPYTFSIPLRKSLKHYRKLRVGDYRIVLRIDASMIFIVAIINRSEVYKKVPRRI